MFKVIWKINGSRLGSCPDYKPDPYTGEYPIFHCAVAHYESYEEEKEKTFETRKEAEEFVLKSPNKADSSLFYTGNTSCSDFQIIEI